MIRSRWCTKRDRATEKGYEWKRYTQPRAKDEKKKRRETERSRGGAVWRLPVVRCKRSWWLTLLDLERESSS